MAIIWLITHSCDAPAQYELNTLLVRWLRACNSLGFFSLFHSKSVGFLQKAQGATGPQKTQGPPRRGLLVYLSGETQIQQGFVSSNIGFIAFTLLLQQTQLLPQLVLW